MRWFVPFVITAAGCAAVPVTPTPTVATAPREPVVEAAAPPEERPTPKQFVASFVRPKSCERAARDVRQQDPELAWRYLRACVSRGSFTLLEVLLARWQTELLQHADSVELLAEVIAARGTIASDLVLLQQAHYPLFDLGSAAAQPRAMRGRLVLFAGQLSGESESDPGAVELAELSGGSIAVDDVQGPRHVTERVSSDRVSGGGAAPLVGQASLSGSWHAASSVREGTIGVRYQNTLNETGRSVTARAPGPLPANRPLVVLGRFDGVPPRLDNVVGAQAQVTVVSVHEFEQPNSWGSCLSAQCRD